MVALVAQAHLGRALDDEIHLLLLLVVPGNLPSVGVQSDIAEREVCGLDGCHAVDEVLRETTGGKSTPGGSGSRSEMIIYLLPKKVR